MSLLSFLAKIRSPEQAILTPMGHLLLQESTPEDIFMLKSSAAKLVAKSEIKGKQTEHFLKKKKN